MSRGPGRTQRMVLELLEGAGGSLPVDVLYRELASEGVNRSNARRAVKGLLERGTLQEKEESAFGGRRVRCVRVVGAVASEASLKDLMLLALEGLEGHQHQLYEQEGAPATPWLGGESLASRAAGEAGDKRQPDGTPHVPPDTPCTADPRGGESVSDNVLRILENTLSPGSPRESDAGGATGRSSDNAVGPGASIAEILDDPEALAFVAWPAPMLPKSNEEEEGGK